MKSLAVPVLLALAVASATAGWLPEERLTERTNVGDYTTDNNGRAIAADPAGNLHVVWYGDCGPENQVWYRWCDAATGEWSQADTISSEPTGACRPSVAADDSGNVHVAWQVGPQTNGTGVRYRQWSASLREWGQVESVADGNHCERPSLACRSPGLVVAAWGQQAPSSYRNVFCARRAAGDWLPAERVSGDFTGGQTSVGVGVDSAGHLGVLWRAAQTTNWLILFRSKDSQGWLDADTLMRDVNSGEPTLWMGADGDAHSAWKVSGSPTGYRIIYRQRSGGIWDDTVWVPRPANNEQLQPSLCDDATGQLHLAWCCDGGEGVQVFYSSADPSGRRWTLPLSLTSATQTRSRPSLATGPGSHVQVVWTDGRYQQTYPDVYFMMRQVEHDVGIAAIPVPGNVVDSGRFVVPTVHLSNGGRSIEYSVPVVLEIGDTYSEDTVLAEVRERETVVVEFPAWTSHSLGSVAVRCSTSIADDECPQNDVYLDSTFVRLIDVAAESIVAPRGRMRPGPVTPSALVSNPGNCSAEFSARMVLRDSLAGVVYSESVGVELAPGQSRNCSFPPFTPEQGRFTAKCSVLMDGDRQPGNDTAASEFVVYEPDVAVTEVLWPPSQVDSGTTGQPAFRVENRGMLATDLLAWFSIGDAHRGPVLIEDLAAGATCDVEFADWTALDRGWNACRCSLLVVPDSVSPATLVESTFVLVRDAAADSILEPVGSIAADTVWPRVLVSNPGNVAVDGLCRTVFRDESLRVAYADSVAFGLAAGASDTLRFRGWAAAPGRYSVRCSIAVDGDRHLENDTVSAEFSVYEPNVVISEVLWPPAELDSGETGTPSFRIENRGVLPTDLWAWFTIEPGYADSAFVWNLPAGSDSVVEFSTWTANGRGWQQCRCLLFVLPESIVGAVRSESTYVRVLDAAVEAIVEPVGPISADTVGPVAVIVNPGNVTATGYCRMVFRDDSARAVYADSIGVELAPGQADTARFRKWPAAPGRYSARCSVGVAGDRQPGNDVAEESFAVFEPDVGVTGITWPPSVVDSGAIGNPVAVVRNFGLGRARFSCRFVIGGHYADTLHDVLLEPGEVDTIEFRDWAALLRGFHPLGCTLFGVGRRDADSPVAGSVFVRVNDAAALEVLSPADTLPPGPVVPSARFANPGNVDVTALCRFRVGVGPAIVHAESISVMLTAGADTAVRFRQWQALPGCYWCDAVVRAAGDLVPGNDSAAKEFLVESLLVEPWTRLADVPEGPRRAPVRDGGRLAGCGDGVLALKGCNTVEWYRYSPATGEWTRLADVPRGESNRRVKTGSALASDGIGSAYLVKGRGTREFYRYDLPGNTWESLPGLPEATAPVRHGAGLCHVPGDTGRLYLLKGSGTNELLVYWVESGKWHAQRPLPAGPRGRPARHGSGLAAVGQRVFALKGGTNEFYEFFPARDSWAARAEVPLSGLSGRTRRCRRGAALASDGERFCFLFKGAGCNETWTYDADGDSWFQREDIPRGERRRRVGRGAALAWCGDRLYALKGGGCRELWSRFASDEVRMTIGESRRGGVVGDSSGIEPGLPAGEHAVLRFGRLSAGPVRVRVFEVSGRCVLSRSLVVGDWSSGIALDIRSLAAGTYLVRLEAEGFTGTQKLVVQR